jgi:hypothetical protein
MDLHQGHAGLRCVAAHLSRLGCRPPGTGPRSSRRCTRAPAEPHKGKITQTLHARSYLMPEGYARYMPERCCSRHGRLACGPKARASRACAWPEGRGRTTSANACTSCRLAGLAACWHTHRLSILAAMNRRRRTKYMNSAAEVAGRAAHPGFHASAALRSALTASPRN